MNRDPVKPSGNQEIPSFSLPLENEILMLKLRCEFGAECISGDPSIPPQMVNQFLQSVYDLETSFRRPAARVSLRSRLGGPAFPKPEACSEMELSANLQRFEALMAASDLQLDFAGDYPLREKYSFIAGEFLDLEVDDARLPGYLQRFCYEDFHPNHGLDINDRCEEFIQLWLQRKMGEYCLSLGDEFVHPDSELFTKERLLAGAQRFFDQYERFLPGGYCFDLLHYEWDEFAQTGLGYATGNLSYSAVTSGGVLVHFDGPVEFFLSNNNEWWSIFYFVVPGFRWRE